MNILVVNDDGYTSDGIKILKNALTNYGNVIVVAPHVEQSAKSASITIRDGLVVHDHGDQVYSVEGTPSDCIKIAIHVINKNIDLVCSGINRGYNLGYDTIYSGTVGAGMEALLNGIPAFALSSDMDEFKNAKKEINKTLDYIFTHNLVSNQYLLNINFQTKDYDEAKGILVTDLGTRNFDVQFELKAGKYYSSRQFKAIEEKIMTDITAVHKGYISITPLKLGNGDSRLVELLNQKIK
jgi:5'-nucleotidase